MWGKDAGYLGFVLTFSPKIYFMCVFYLRVCLCTLFMSVPREVRSVLPIPRNCYYD